MRRTLPDDGGATFEQILADAQCSLWRFEQQPGYHIDDEAGLLAAFAQGQPFDPNQAPGLRAWFDQVRRHTRRGVHVGRVRVVDSPPTLYQRWLHELDRWNTEAGEQIDYLPRPVYAQHNTNRRSRLWSPFPGAGTPDWWLVDNKLALIMHFDRDGCCTKVEVSEEPLEIANAIIHASQARNLAREIVRRAAAPAPRAA
jgi:uncharacterized protein DUF6879